MIDGEREIDIPAVGDSDESARGDRQIAGAADSSPGSEEQRDATRSSPSDTSRIDVNDIDSSMGVWRNQEYGEVM